MKTLHTLTDGTRLVLISRDEWDGLATATDIAYEDESCVPEPLQEIGRSLWNTFHAVTADVARPSQAERIAAETTAIAEGLHREAASIEATRAAEARQADEADHYRRAQAASDALCAWLPGSIGNWHRDGDTMSGAIFWHRPDVRAVVYATPSWEGLPGTPVAVLVDGSTEQIDRPSLPVDALAFVGNEEAGADAYVRAISPVLDAVFEEYATRKSGKPAFRITIDGDLSLPFYAFPEAGAFFGVAAESGKDVLYNVPMGADGQPAEDVGEGDVCEVTNMSEHGDRDLLASINTFFGTQFTPEQFPGR